MGAGGGGIYKGYHYCWKPWHGFRLHRQLVPLNPKPDTPLFGLSPSALTIPMRPAPSECLITSPYRLGFRV